MSNSKKISSHFSNKKILITEIPVLKDHGCQFFLKA